MMDEIRQFRGSTPVITREAEEAARARLLRAMREPAMAPAPVKRRRVPRLAWRLAIAATAAVAIGGGMVVVRGADQPATVAVASVEELGERAAESVLGEVVPSPGQWLYVKTVLGAQISPPRPEVDPVKRETIDRWFSLDGKQVAETTETGKLVFADLTSEFEEPGPVITGRDLAQAPVTPEGVLAKVTEVVEKTPASPFDDGASKQQLVFVRILELMAGEPLTPEVRAALFRALPMIEGVTLKQDAVDAAGRKGVAFAFPGRWELLEIILNAEDFAFLGTYVEAIADRTFPGGGLVKAGSVTGWSAQLETVVVDEPGKRQ
ncbi:CU044_5270 family protein [Nonomuraea sp. NPDC059194]|uniref:CU044_5270 family protein n=1 Tax=Nonomuraea sp. NPDC059194 TaxID=3346764 RepID=UPI0036ABF392